MAGTRDRIITASNELFRGSGYHGTSLSSISSAAGAPVGSIYHFFPGGKDELTVAVIASTGAAYRDLFDMIAGAADGPAAAFVDFFEGAAAVLEENGYLDPCPIGTIARETANTNESIRVASKSAFASWVTAATDYLIAGGVEAQQARDLALVFVAAIEGGFVLSRTLRDGEPLRAAGRTLAPLVDAAVGVTP